MLRCLNPPQPPLSRDQTWSRNATSANRMNRELQGVRYATVLASDLQRDGMGLELHCRGVAVAEIFASDKDGSWTLTTFDRDVPLELIEELIAEAKARLPSDETTSP